MRVEERFVIQLEHGQVDARRDRHDLRGNFITRLVGLDLHLAGIKDHVGTGENPFTFDDDAATGCLMRCVLGPGFVQIGVTHGGKHLYDRVRHGVRVGRDIGIRRPGADRDEGHREAGG